MSNTASGIALTMKAQGVRIGTDGNGIGDVAERNVITGNLLRGIEINGLGTNNNIVAGNFIGTNAAGTSAFGSGFVSGRWGVNIAGGAKFNRVGTNADGIADAAERNVISGNRSVGVVIQGLDRIRML